jgi:hypothetical protein
VILLLLGLALAAAGGVMAGSSLAYVNDCVDECHGFGLIGGAGVFLAVLGLMALIAGAAHSRSI